MIVESILMLALLALLAKARPKRGRRMGRYLKGIVDTSLSLTTLGAKSLAKGNFDNVVNERTLVSSVVASYSLRSFTQGTDDGPIMVGLAHSDYDVAEIEAYIENTGSWNEGDMVSQEVGKRKIRIVGIFDVPANALEVSVLNDGKPIKSKLNWVLLQSQTVAVWAYNLGASALATTVPVVQIEGHANLWPR